MENTRIAVLDRWYSIELSRFNHNGFNVYLFWIHMTSPMMFELCWKIFDFLCLPTNYKFLWTTNVMNSFYKQQQQHINFVNNFILNEKKQLKKCHQLKWMGKIVSICVFESKKWSMNEQFLHPIEFNSYQLKLSEINRKSITILAMP